MTAAMFSCNITNLQRVGVEDFVQLGSLPEVFKHKGAKSSADVRLNVLPEWRAIPYNVS